MFKAISYLSVVTMLFAALLVLREPVIAQIAPGVLQSAAHTATITGTVTQSDGTPIVDADVQLLGPAVLATTSDAHGTFSFISVPYGTYRIITNVAKLGVASHDNVIVKGDITVAIQYVSSGSSGLKTIAHVSTHSAGASINVTPASVVSINPSEYAFQGNTSWKELLDQIPGVTVGGGLGGGGYSGSIIPDAPFQPIILSINGALPYETSVTLDGMPVINTSEASSGQAGGTADLYSLPMTNFDAADIVRGPGANAPSIVDSIGGSFVLHAPGQVDRNRFEFSMSNDPYGGIVSNAKALVRFGKLSATILYGLNNSPGPFGNQSIMQPNGITPLTVNGQLFNGCSPGGPAPCATFPSSTPQYQNCYCLPTNSLLYCCVPYSTAWTEHDGTIGLSYSITPSITAQVFYAGSSSEMTNPGFKYVVDYAPGLGYSGSITPGQYIFTDADSYTIAQASSIVEEKFTAYIGHGVLRLAALQNNSFAKEQALSYEPNGQYIVYGTGYYTSAPNTPVNFNGTSESLTFGSYVYDYESWINNRDLLVSYSTQIGTASTVGVSYVTSYYNDPFKESSSAFYAGYGIYAFSLSRPPSVSETTKEIRIHASTNIFNKLSIDASWYFAHGLYHVVNPADPATWANPDFSYSAPRVGAVWRANSNTVIRASAGGGYALPPLYYLVGGSGVPFCGPSTCSVSLTNLNLKPEEAFGFDIGADMRFHRNTVFSLDLYRTNLYGQFFNSTNLTGTFAGLPLYTTEYGNVSHSRYEGINLDVRHEVPTGLYWHGAIGLTRAYVVSVPAGFYNSITCPPPSFNPVVTLNSANTYIVPGINFDGQYQSTVPYANGSAQLGYRWSAGKYIDLSPTYYGKNNPYFEPAFIEFDAHAGYALTKNVSLVATFRNITGIYGQNYETLSPSIGAPSVAGQPYALFGMPYGPRTVIVTVNFND